MVGKYLLLGGGGGGCGVVFFFFKQKTAYEMCGRDWSSDVCSSDLIDILLTSPWPKGVSAYGTELKHSLNNESDSIAQLTLALRPRYHFSGVEGVSYERNPYRNHTVLSGQSSHVSRFVALADVGNKEKRKYLYAFNIVPMKYLDKDELHKQPADTTECPYKLKVDSRSLAQQAPERNAFFYGEAPMSGQKRRGRSIDCTYTDYSNSNVHM